MVKIIAVFLICFTSISCRSQNVKVSKNDKVSNIEFLETHKNDNLIDCESYYDTLINKIVYKKVEIMPTFKFGVDSLLNYYGEIIRLSSFEREVYEEKINLSFYIMSNGKVLHPTIFNKEKNNYNALEKLIISKTSELKGWNPAKCKDSSVSYRYMYPIRLHPS